MIANLKMDFAVMATLFVMLLQVEADPSDICGKISSKIVEDLSAEEIAHDPNKVYSSSKRVDRSSINLSTRRSLRHLHNAWYTVAVHRPPTCLPNYLGQLRVIAECRPEDSDALTTLTQATENYARKCLTPGNIERLINDTLNSWWSQITLTDLENFIDRQFIDDYKKYSTAGSAKPDAAEYRKSMIAKAIDRNLHMEKFKNINTRQVYDNLIGLFQRTCDDFVDLLKTHIENLKVASKYVAGFDELVAALNQETQNHIFRYTFCKDIDVREILQPDEYAQEILDIAVAESP